MTPGAFLKKLLEHPLTRNLRVDDPMTTELRRCIIREKVFLRKLYCEWYGNISRSLPKGDGKVLELGSGAGFMKDFVPGLITSDVIPVSDVDHVIDGCRIPMDEGALKAIVMTDVLHHMADVRSFFHEAYRCVRPGGMIVMIEPWVTTWSRLVYKHLHHEPFDPDAATWDFEVGGPLSDANGALPWILFERDRNQFEAEYPGWKIRRIRLDMPFSYIVSGGVSMRSLMPGFTYAAWRLLERGLKPWMKRCAMFAQIELERGI